MQSLREIISATWKPEETHAHPHRREAAQMLWLWEVLFYSSKSEDTHDDPFRRDASQMRNVQQTIHIPKWSGRRILSHQTENKKIWRTKMHVIESSIVQWSYFSSSLTNDIHATLCCIFVNSTFFYFVLLYIPSCIALVVTIQTPDFYLE